jgi:hypothetical protein
MMQNIKTQELTQEIITKQFESVREISKKVKTFCDIASLVSEGWQIEINGDTFYDYHNGKLMFEFIDFSDIKMLRFESDSSARMNSAGSLIHIKFQYELHIPGI